MTLGRQGELDRAVEFSLRCIQREKALRAEARREEAAGGIPAVPTLVPFLSRIYLMQGNLHACSALCREYLTPYLDKGIRFIYTTGSMQIDLGEVLYEWNCLEDAEQHIREGLQSNKPWRNIMTDGFGLIALTRVLQAKGNYAEAMQVVEKFETILRENAQPREFMEALQTLRVRI